MSRARISEQEWQTFLDIADRLQIPVRKRLLEDVRFTAMEAAGHELGRAVAQIATQRLALARAERLTELQDHAQQQASAHADQTLQAQYAEPPQVVSVSVDGGRIMTRADAGRGVHEQAWKETKNACLLTLSSSISQEDPHPQLPACFADREYVEKLVREIRASAAGSTPKTQETPPISEDLDDESAALPSCSPSCSPNAPPKPKDTQKAEPWLPKRLVRTCLSSMVCSDEFGPLVAGEAQRRGFYRAERRAFVGDGQAGNWTRTIKRG